MSLDDIAQLWAEDRSVSAISEAFALKASCRSGRAASLGAGRAAAG